jgi:putative flippase GtrA
MRPVAVVQYLIVGVTCTGWHTASAYLLLDALAGAPDRRAEASDD